MFTDEAVCCSAAPISSAIDMNRPLKISSRTGSAAVPIATAAVRGAWRVRIRLPSRSTAACQPGSTTVVGARIDDQRAPEHGEPGG